MRGVAGGAVFDCSVMVGDCGADHRDAVPERPEVLRAERDACGVHLDRDYVRRWIALREVERRDADARAEVDDQSRLMELLGWEVPCPVAHQIELSDIARAGADVQRPIGEARDRDLGRRAEPEQATIDRLGGHPAELGQAKCQARCTELLRRQQIRRAKPARRRAGRHDPPDARGLRGGLGDRRPNGVVHVAKRLLAVALGELLDPKQSPTGCGRRLVVATPVRRDRVLEEHAPSIDPGFNEQEVEWHGQGPHACREARVAVRRSVESSLSQANNERVCGLKSLGAHLPRACEVVGCGWPIAEFVAEHTRLVVRDINLLDPTSHVGTTAVPLQREPHAVVIAGRPAEVSVGLGQVEG